MPTPKTLQPRRPATPEGVMLWLMHRFADKFGHHAVLKGGMALRLIDSPRHTNDLDYVFVPYASKNDIAPFLEPLLAELEEATTKVTLHSTMVRCEVRLDSAVVQVEANVDRHCASVPQVTASLANPLGEASRVVRIMEPGVALAHKLAAWNERRLVRDVYDIYFLVARAQVLPDLQVLQSRLANTRSRLPQLRKRKSMTLEAFSFELTAEVGALTDSALVDQLGGLVDRTELAGLAMRMRAAINRLADAMRTRTEPEGR